MTFREYLESINTFAEQFPEALDLDVVYASDDEGNSFQPVYEIPSLGWYVDREFYPKEDDIEEINAVCIN